MTWEGAADLLPERIVLVGFMAAGKSTVGRLVAERLGYRFLDLDQEVTRLAGRTVAEIFAAEGEDGFRRRELEATRAADRVRPVVVAAGGGWMSRPETRERWPDAVRVLLEVSPEEALRRLGPAVSSRPLLDPRDPASARRLWEARIADYATAEIRVPTEGRDPEEVADEVVRAVRTFRARLRGRNP